MVNTATKMSSNRKFIVVSILIFLSAIVLYAFNEYNRKPADLSVQKPQETITAMALLAAFKNNEEIANKLYLGKTVLITGLITEINNEQDTLMNIYLGDSSAFEKVSCKMDMRKKDSFLKLIPGQQISLIGFCTGYLQDVELDRCVIVLKNK